MAGLELVDPIADSVRADEPRFEPGGLTRVEVAPAAPVPSPRPLLRGTESFCHPSVRDWHRPMRSVQRPPAACYFATGATVWGCGFMSVGGRVAASEEFMPEYARRFLEVDSGGGDRLLHWMSRPVREVEGPCVVPMSFGCAVYGHFLIEMLPQLLLASRVTDGAGMSPRLLLERRTPDWLLTILREQFGYGRDRIEFYDPRQEQIRLRQAIRPALLNCPFGFHPVVGPMLDEFIGTHGLNGSRGGSELVFITRQFVTGSESLQRRCLNEGATARIAAARGFSVFAPERLPWRSQIALFRDARVVVGQAGSALHNALFGSAGARVASIGALTRAQSYIGALRGQDNAFLALEDERPGLYELDGSDAPGDYTVDEAEFTAFLDAVTAGA